LCLSGLYTGNAPKEQRRVHRLDCAIRPVNAAFIALITPSLPFNAAFIALIAQSLPFNAAFIALIAPSLPVNAAFITLIAQSDPSTQRSSP
jgi:hypothetical protein